MVEVPGAKHDDTVIVMIAFPARTVRHQNNKNQSCAEEIHAASAHAGATICLPRKRLNAIGYWRRKLSFRNVLIRGSQSPKPSRPPSPQSKDVFVNTILRLEFAEELNTRALVMPLHFSRKEINQSRCYKHYKNFPLDFQGFLPFVKTVAPKRNPAKEYEDEYDELRRQNRNAEFRGSTKISAGTSSS